MTKSGSTPIPQHRERLPPSTANNGLELNSAVKQIRIGTPITVAQRCNRRCRSNSSATASNAPRNTQLAGQPPRLPPSVRPAQEHDHRLAHRPWADRPPRHSGLLRREPQPARHRAHGSGADHRSVLNTERLANEHPTLIGSSPGVGLQAISRPACAVNASADLAETPTAPTARGPRCFRRLNRRLCGGLARGLFRRCALAA